ncbi:MAG: GAF domain-containing protein [Phycisphaerae bacterium]|nr:GAF domain-containing protein [Phycisphaerae bacterium]
MSTQFHEKSILLLTVDGAEKEELHSAFDRAGFKVQHCENVESLCAGLVAGVGLAVVAHEAINNEMSKIASALEGQAAWSDVALVVLCGGFDSPDHSTIGPSSNFTLLERPVSPHNLLSIVGLALRAREHQYGRRDEQIEHAHSDLYMKAHAVRMGERIEQQAKTLRLIRDVATAANFADTVEDAISFVLAQVCEFNGWVCGAAYLPSLDDSSLLIPIDASYEHDQGRFRPLLEETLTLQFKRGKGLPGRVFASGQPEWTRGIEKEMSGRRKELGEQLGIHTAAAFPILAGSEVIGVLEFLSQTRKDPTLEQLDVMASIGTQLGRVLERDRLDRALRDSVRLVQKIADTAPTMIRILDTEEQRYWFVNRQMAQFFGMNVDKLLSKNRAVFLDAVSPEDQKLVDEAMEKVLHRTDGVPVTWRVRVRNAAGEWRWLRTWSVLFAQHESGSARHILNISMDVTQHVESEERLRQTERLTSIGILAAGIAHEINNPLASVVMTAQLLRKRNPGDETDRMLGNIIEDAKRCGRIVRNVQRFARQEPSHREPLDLNSVVKAAIQLSTSERNYAGIGLKVDLSEPLPAIEGDAAELEQVVLNLVSNACHASARGQEIQVRTASVGGMVQLAVQDEGQGMAPDVKRHVFDPFYTTRGSQGGTGLGLSIVHGIVEEHGGRIDIDSEVGRGTTVRVSFPVAEGGSDGTADHE